MCSRWQRLREASLELLLLNWDTLKNCGAKVGFGIGAVILPATPHPHAPVRLTRFEFHSDPQDHPIRIKAVPNGKYILSESEQGSSLQNIHFKRVGKDLHITLEDTDTDQPQLIIEADFDTQGDSDLLMDSVPSPLSDASQPSGLVTLLEGGINWFWPVLLGLGGLIVGGSTRGSTGGNGTTAETFEDGKKIWQAKMIN